MGSLTDVTLWDLVEDKLVHRWDGVVQPKPAKANEGGGSLAYAPNGLFVAWGTGYSYASGIARSDLKVWDVHSLEEIGGKPLFKNNSCLTNVAFTPDGTLLVAADHAGWIRLWDTTNWQRVSEFNIGGHIWVIAPSPDGTALAIGEGAA